MGIVDFIKKVKLFRCDEAKEKNENVLLGCFKENLRAKKLYQKIGFVCIYETDTHYILEYKN
ncbi:MAG: hypothetical protein E7262_10020 [Lachnospiraceae bacterium]|nr:hypothetical protein [Lachnospiraceae bacterium]